VRGARLSLIAIAAAMAVALALVLGACGSSSSAPASGTDPATAAPADSVLYGDVTVRPEGAQKDAVDGALSKLLGTSDIATAIVSRLDKSFAKAGITYSGDVQPWLGSRVGFFLSKIASGTGSEGAFIVSTTDPAAAKDTLAKVAANASSGSKVTSETYKGVSYSVQDSGSGQPSAYGLVGDLLVAGTVDGFKAAVDAANGSSLASSHAYTSAIASAPAERLATFYADPKLLLEAVVKGGGLGANGLKFAKLLQGSGTTTQPVVAWADATSSSLALEVSAAAQKGASTGSSLISGFPSDAWIAFGTHGVGDMLNRGLGYLNSLPSSALGGRTPQQALDTVRQKTGLDLAGFAKWLGDVSGYVSGSSVFSLGGALVLSSSDTKASSQTLGQIEHILQNDVDLTVSPLSGGGFKVVPSSAPVEIDVQQRGDKVVAGLGSSAVDNALSPASTLGSTGAFKTAEGTLGSSLTPSFYLDFAPISGLLSLSGASAAPQIQQAKPYLDRLDYLIAGSGVANGRRLSRIVLGLRDGSGTTGNVTAALTTP